MSTTIDLSKLTRFEKANLGRLDKSIAPTQAKIDRERAKLIAYTKEATTKIDAWEKELIGFKQLRSDILNKYVVNEETVNTSEEASGDVLEATNAGSGEPGIPSFTDEDTDSVPFA